MIGFKLTTASLTINLSFVDFMALCHSLNAVECGKSLWRDQGTTQKTFLLTS